MILLADSGSTKTDWSLVDDKQLIRQIQTKGTNPFFQKEEDISREIEDTLLPQLTPYEPDSLYFYGAGCTIDKATIVKKAIGKHLNITKTLEVNTDMLAAARSMCGHQPGIACILGTGSNSCLYDGKDIIKNISPLGFILGDEGSGAVLGKTLVGDILKHQLSEDLEQKFMSYFNLSCADIIEKVYRQPFPNRFLASLSIFLEKNIDAPGIHELLVNNFKAFLKRNVMQYEDYNKYPIHFVGSIAFFYHNELKIAIEEMGMKLGSIARSPMEGLIKYHTT